MTYPRSDIVCTLAGVEYRSETVASDGTVTVFRKGSPAPNDPRFRYDEKWDLWEAVVPIEECDRLVEISSFARYKGAPCQVMSIGQNGQALVYYTGHSGTEAEKAGFEQIDPGTYANTVPARELHDYHEIHRDLLFKHWRASTFGEVTA